MYALAQALGQCNGPAVPGTCSLYRRPLRIIEPGPFVSSYYFTIVKLTRFGKEVKYFVADASYVGSLGELSWAYFVF